jgi:hypothetical protein
MTTTLQQDWLKAFYKLQELSDSLEVGDPFNYNRAREIHTAFLIGLSVSSTLAGADAYDTDGEAELKSTTGKLKATYNGISVLPSWEEQEEYLTNEKIGKYSNHYITRYEGSNLVECWKMKGEDVLMLLLPKLKKQYHSSKSRKDPRLSTSLGAVEIRTYGELIDTK